MKRLLIIGLIFIVFPKLVSAQENLGGVENLAAFSKKTKRYQYWLDKKGLGEILKVDKYELKKNDMELELFLTVKTFDHDTAMAMWSKLERTFPLVNNQMAIEEALYYTFTRMMEINPDQGNIQIYFPREDGFGYSPCFYVWIWEENGAIVTKKKINNCRAQTLDIAVAVPAVKKVNQSSQKIISRNHQSNLVFESIFNFAIDQYEGNKIKYNSVCSERKPKVSEKKISGSKMTFAVTDLCREVLTEETKSYWCNFVEVWWGPCNDMRRERLEFTFYYIPTDDGYTLSGSLTGKFGSGIYRPRISGYMDMEPDFENDYLVPYVLNFQEGLKTYLEQIRP